MRYMMAELNTKILISLTALVGLALLLFILKQIRIVDKVNKLCFYNSWERNKIQKAYTLFEFLNGEYNLESTKYVKGEYDLESKTSRMEKYVRYFNIYLRSGYFNIEICQRIDDVVIDRRNQRTNEYDGNTKVIETKRMTLDTFEGLYEKTFGKKP